jgi:predicted RNA-binding protein (virulence factor B family)
MAALQLGKRNQLKVLRKKEHGVYLEGGDIGDILLPKRYVPQGTKIGDILDVFLYLDQEERLVATTQTPFAQVDDFAWLEVAWVNQFGAFLDWGLMKDLFVPFGEQKMKMQKGRSYLVHVHLDPETFRIMASAKVEHYFSERMPDFHHGQEVDILVWQKTELGFKVIIDNCYPGLLYENQIFKPVHTGDRMKAYIDHVRPDGKVDLTLQPTGRQQTLDFADTLLLYLNQHDGLCDLGDKSEAEDIKERFQVSKKTFKKAIGDLYRRRLITVSPTSIALNTED